jgi:hypothetical protein
VISHLQNPHHCFTVFVFDLLGFHEKWTLLNSQRIELARFMYSKHDMTTTMSFMPFSLSSCFCSPPSDSITDDRRPEGWHVHNTHD